MDPETPEKQKARRALMIILVLAAVFVTLPLMIYLVQTFGRR